MQTTEETTEQSTTEYNDETTEQSSSGEPDETTECSVQRSLDSTDTRLNFNYSFIFALELCCFDGENLLIAQLDSLDISLSIYFNRIFNLLVINQTYTDSNYVIKNVSLLNKQLVFFTFSLNNSINLYYDCMHTPTKRSDRTIILNNMLQFTKFESYNYVQVFDNIKKISNLFTCPKKFSTFDGNIVYFHGEFISQGTSLISFKYDSETFFICYQNNEMQIKNSSNSKVATIDLRADHNFDYGLYLYFRSSSLEIYDNCPSSPFSNSIGSWETSIFSEKTFITTYKPFISAEAATLSTLKSFCSKANLLKSGLYERSSCYPIESLVDSFTLSKNSMQKYMPTSYTLTRLNLARNVMPEKTFFLDNKQSILFASRENSKFDFFNRSLEEYEDGFTDGQFNFWLGLDVLHKITSSNDLKLKIVAISQTKLKYVEEYSLIKVANSSDNYRLILGKLVSGKNGHFAYYNNTQFSAYDAGDSLLALKYLAGFWHKENKTFCFNCADNIINQISTTNITFSNAKNVQIYNSKIYLVVIFYIN